MRAMTRIAMAIVVMAFSFTDARAQSSETRFLVTFLGTLGGDRAWAQAMNDHGQVVGYSDTSGGDVHGFLWDQGVMTDLATLGGGYSRAHDINNSGVIVGESDGRAVSWTSGAITDLDTLQGGTASRAYAINDSGEIVGQSNDGSGEWHASRWGDTGTTNLAPLLYAVDINNYGTIVGGDYIWDEGVAAAILPPNYGSGNARAINDSNMIVGDFGEALPYVLKDGEFDWPEMAPADNWAIPMDINNSGYVVGGAPTSGWLWHESTGRIDPSDRIPSSGGDWVSRALAINELGEIVCEILDVPEDLSGEPVYRQAVLTPLPEGTPWAKAHSWIEVGASGTGGFHCVLNGGIGIDNYHQQHLSRGSTEIVSWLWDLDGDGEYDDASGETVILDEDYLLHTIGLSLGKHPIALKVITADGAEDWTRDELDFFIPEPSSLSLLALGGLAVMRGKRR